MEMGFIRNSDGNIRVHTTEGTDYVMFYKGARIIPIPYECLVCFVGNNLKEPEPIPENVECLERFIVGKQARDFNKRKHYNR